MQEGTVVAQAGSQLYGAAIQELGTQRACVVVAIGILLGSGLWIMDSAKRCTNLELSLYGITAGSCGLIVAVLSFLAMSYQAYRLHAVGNRQGMREQLQQDKEDLRAYRRTILKANTLVPPLLTIFAAAYLAVLHPSKGVLQDLAFVFGKTLLLAGISCWILLFLTLRYFW